MMCVSAPFPLLLLPPQSIICGVFIICIRRTAVAFVRRQITSSTYLVRYLAQRETEHSFSSFCGGGAASETRRMTKQVSRAQMYILEMYINWDNYPPTTTRAHNTVSQWSNRVTVRMHLSATLCIMELCESKWPTYSHGE